MTSGGWDSIWDNYCRLGYSSRLAFRVIYFCHPITSGKRTLEENLARIGKIVSRYPATVIVLNPWDVLREAGAGDQTRAYLKSLFLVRQTGIMSGRLHVAGDWWNSTGCRLEITEALLQHVIVEKSPYDDWQELRDPPSRYELLSTGTQKRRTKEQC